MSDEHLGCRAARAPRASILHKRAAELFRGGMRSTVKVGFVFGVEWRKFGSSWLMLADVARALYYAWGNYAICVDIVVRDEFTNRNVDFLLPAQVPN